MKVGLLHLCLYERLDTHKWQGNCDQMVLELFLKTWFFEKIKSNWIYLLNIECNFIHKAIPLFMQITLAKSWSSRKHLTRHLSLATAWLLVTRFSHVYPAD